MHYYKNNLDVYVALASTAAINDFATFKTSAVVGEVNIFATDGTVASLASGSKFFFAQKTAQGNIITSEVIDPALATRQVKDYVAPTQQKTIIGYNGTDGAIVVNNSETYMINMWLYNYGALSVLDRKKKHGIYKASSAATQAEIATGLQINLYKNFTREPSQVMTFNLLSDDAGAVITGTGNLTFVNGSPWVTAATDADAVMSVNDYLRVGTAVSSPVYKIVEIDATANKLKLAIPYQGASATVLEANAEYIAAAGAATADFGIVLEGVEQEWRLNKIEFATCIPHWDTFTTEAFGDTEVRVAVQPSFGNGYGKEVADIEALAFGTKGEMYRMGEPHLYPSHLVTDVTKNYDIQNIVFTTSENQLINPTQETRSFLLAIDESLGTQDVVSNLTTVFS